MVHIKWSFDFVSWSMSYSNVCLWCFGSVFKKDDFLNTYFLFHVWKPSFHPMKLVFLKRCKKNGFQRLDIKDPSFSPIWLHQNHPTFISFHQMNHPTFRTFPCQKTSQGTVNAGFGTTWNEATAARLRYQRRSAREELQGALQGQQMPVTDDHETLGGKQTVLGWAPKITFYSLRWKTHLWIGWHCLKEILWVHTGVANDIRFWFGECLWRRGATPNCLLAHPLAKGWWKWFYSGWDRINEYKIPSSS